jgi:hypothetical protein
MTTGFTAVIRIRGGNPFILVSASRATAIKPGWRKPLPVLVRVNGKPANALAHQHDAGGQRELLSIPARRYSKSFQYRSR